MARTIRGWRIVTVAMAAAAACRSEPAPARIMAGASDTVLLNNRNPIRIPLRVLDATGQQLADTGVRFVRIGGDDLPVTAEGVVSCPHSGDLTVRASLGAVSANLFIQCRPVQIVGVAGPVNLVLGDSARELPVVALGPDGLPVRQVSVTVIVRDTSVAKMEGSRLRTLMSGATMVDVRAGDADGSASVKVYDPVTTLEGLRKDQEHVSVRLRLYGGGERRWPLPEGDYMLWILPYEYDGRGLQVRMEGAMCEPQDPKPRSGGFANPPKAVCRAKAGASIVVSHPSTRRSAPAINGTLLLRQLYPPTVP